MTTTSTASLGGSSPEAAADSRAVIQGSGFRITVLTSRLLRLEYSATDRFTDRATEMVVQRRFDVPEFTVQQDDQSLDIWTEHLHLSYDKRPFSAAGLSITLRVKAQESHRTAWHYGDPTLEPPGALGNLGGTTRTLDGVDGACELDPGLLATYGFAVVADTSSIELSDDGWFASRSGDAEDLYFFGYGRDFQAALQDFFVLTGPTPLLPRWALGNWWSRYHPYSANEYLELLDHFDAENVPISVAVLDMDWHLVDIDPALGSGWTGYTWNHELFPDPKAFLTELHRRHKKVSLNVHPADGVRSHEDAYPEVAGAMNVDPESGLGVAFDITSREFTDAYLRFLHHPHEELGVDFWWLDWQSGKNTKVPGLDPLWMLNHLHFTDNARDGERPLILSRYAGPGSHRYPVGFSGDTITSWASLEFQPYFTATAANIGYFWWSHDIGGHLGGHKDNELATRWFQFGVFSPINRLHSAHSDFNTKEPWRFSAAAQTVMQRFLRLRHQLVPYLYSAARRAHTDGIALVRPMYHDYSQSPEAYEVPNQYLFGPDLLVMPITTPVDRQTHLAGVVGWLPPGEWFDIFTGRRYQGDRTVTLHRLLDNIPVLARVGTVLPLQPDAMADVADNPESLTLLVFPGADRACEILEDDGGAEASGQRTIVKTGWRTTGPRTGEMTVSLLPPTGLGVRTTRNVTVVLVGAAVMSGIVLEIGVAGTDILPTAVTDFGSGLFTDGVSIELGLVDLSAGANLTIGGVQLRAEEFEAAAFALLDQAEISFEAKHRAQHAMQRLRDVELVVALDALHLPGNLFAALLELISTADSFAVAEN